jgi:hypothetical protein
MEFNMAIRKIKKKFNKKISYEKQKNRELSLEITKLKARLDTLKKWEDI